MWKKHNIEKIKRSQHHIQENTNSKEYICKKCTAPDSNAILTLEQVAKELKLDPRTVKRVAFELGGRRIGNRWRFNWSSVLEYFNNAKFENRQRKPMVGKSSDKWEASSLQILSIREKTRSRMENCKRMGRGAEKTDFDGDNDPHGLGTAYLVGE